jgi:hypothetical protein
MRKGARFFLFFFFSNGDFSLSLSVFPVPATVRRFAMATEIVDAYRLPGDPRERRGADCVTGVDIEPGAKCSIASVARDVDGGYLHCALAPSAHTPPHPHTEKRAGRKKAGGPD